MEKKYHTVGIVPKYHTVGIVPKYNHKIVERGKVDTNTHIYELLTHIYMSVHFPVLCLYTPTNTHTYERSLSCLVFIYPY